ncbi:hypothetical protein [Streptomyces sp. S.PB5]|uniref:hypothetical protein n=1 Tax=Streptomyces sp. S.PB5 TaxID=3020844 RepID=UPI0025B114AD|nr:hypothetical protein [Streptomyces sp. S.PB5]MDN3021737.1 hypothetical protein [Streptomyces sp. S.PB5]
MSDPHRRLLGDILAVGSLFPLAVSGSCAVRAHGLLDGAGDGVSVATENPARMEFIAATVRAGLEECGWRVRTVGRSPLTAQLIVTAPDSGAEYEVELAKEVFWRPPVPTGLGPALALEDVIGTKVRALADLGLPRDLVDVHAGRKLWSHPELEELGRRHTRDPFDLTDLQARLAATDWIDDAEFTARGLDDGAVVDLRRWAQEWAYDIAERLIEGQPPEE